MIRNSLFLVIPLWPGRPPSQFPAKPHFVGNGQIPCIDTPFPWHGKYRHFVDCAGLNDCAVLLPHLELSSVNLRTALKSLLILVLGLPVGSVILTWVAGLLLAMGDVTAANALSQINTAVRVFWLVSLVGIVVVLGLESLDRNRDLE